MIVMQERKREAPKCCRLAPAKFNFIIHMNPLFLFMYKVQCLLYLCGLLFLSRPRLALPAINEEYDFIGSVYFASQGRSDISSI